MNWYYIVGYLLGLANASLSKEELNAYRSDPMQAIRDYEMAFNWPSPPKQLELNEFNTTEFLTGYRSSSLFGDKLILRELYRR